MLKRLIMILFFSFISYGVVFGGIDDIKMRWDPVEGIVDEVNGTVRYRVYCRLEGQTYDATKVIWDSAVPNDENFGATTVTLYYSSSSLYFNENQKYIIPGNEGDKVYFVVTAYNNCGESEYSNEVSCYVLSEECDKFVKINPIRTYKIQGLNITPAP